MDSDRIKELHEQTAHPESISVYKALLQVWNECQQEYNEQLHIGGVSNRFINDSDLDTIKELRDLMEDVINGNYKPDSFTNQPIKNLIERLENGC